MNAETLLKWKEAGVLFEFNGGGDDWSTPMRLLALGNHGLYTAENGKHYRNLMPYRAPGHIQPHDGSSERPELVAEDALVVPCETTETGTFWYQHRFAYEIEWQSVRFFIVLPSIGGNNEN